MTDVEPLRIWYHGTSEANAESIMREGFRRGTYFGECLADALGYGGPYVFEVAFPKAWRSEAGWQMTIPEAVGPGRIIRLRRYEVETLHEDETAGQRVFESNMEGELGVPGDCGHCGKPMRDMRWSDVYRRDHGLVELCSRGCVEGWEAEHDRA